MLCSYSYNIDIRQNCTVSQQRLQHNKLNTIKISQCGQTYVQVEWRGLLSQRGTQYRPLNDGPESTESSTAGLSKAGMFHQTGVSFHYDQRFLSWIGKYKSE